MTTATAVSKSGETFELLRTLMRELLVDEQPINQRKVRHVVEELEGFYGMSLDQMAKEKWSALVTTDRADQRLLERTGEADVVNRYYGQTERYVAEASYIDATHEKQSAYRLAYLACRKFRVPVSWTTAEGAEA